MKNKHGEAAQIISDMRAPTQMVRQSGTRDAFGVRTTQERPAARAETPKAAVETTALPGNSMRIRI
jgi:hypothetical protein